MLKAVIMDFDGVVIDSEAIWHDLYVEWFKTNHNYNLTVEEFLLCVGSNYESLFSKLEEKMDISIDREKFLEDTMELFIEKSDNLPAKEGVVDFIKSVKEKGLGLSLATSSVRAKPVKHLTRLGLIDYFDYLVTADDVERIKPFPDLYLKAIDNLKVDKEEAVVIEDSQNGLIAANRAGVKTIIVPNEETKYSNFESYYKKVVSLREVQISNLISEFN
ncbi:HAD family phosphatase [Paucisalibacillus sp. EB02]|uniref:HAD family hydrolase n=1 Tax=Paucisalibacillus sp. EB02 TaxID=1347087 RepID=UPI0004B2E6FC|nr:HAD-IA family hydrolase [Paucisalibacillus sp. EB02]